MTGDHNGAHGALLFPIGHLGGMSWAGPAPADGRYEVRTGAVFHRLPPTEFAVWVAAHGGPVGGGGAAAAGGSRWTRRQVEMEARRIGVATPETHVGSLVEAGLLAVATPGTPAADRFARTHRILPLMLGLGNSAAEPGRFMIGHQAIPVLGVHPLLYGVWAWSAAADHLWHACQLTLEQELPDGSPPPSDDELRHLLASVLTRVHTMLALHAACFDQVPGWESAEDPPTPAGDGT